MNKDLVIQSVNELLADNKIKEALELLSAYVKGIDSYLETDLLLQTAAFNRNSNDFNSNLVPRDEYLRSLARTNLAITQIMERLPDYGNLVQIKVKPSPPPPPATKKVILFLTANPSDTGTLRLDLELRKVKDHLAQSTSRDSFELISETAVKISTITGAMQKNKPYIVHFSGHGSGTEGLVIEGDGGETVLFPTQGLTRLFNIFKDQVKCVVLNACYSKIQAKEISKQGIHVIGMNDAIEDDAAIDFAIGFYQSIGEGNTFEFAYNIAMVNISHRLANANTPEIWYSGKKL